MVVEGGFVCVWVVVVGEEMGGGRRKEEDVLQRERSQTEVMGREGEREGGRERERRAQ